MLKHIPILFLLTLSCVSSAFAGNATELIRTADKYFAEGSYSMAVDSYTEAIDSDPTAGVPYHLRGRTFFYLGKYSEAEMDYASAIALIPRDPSPYIGRSRCRILRGDYNGALEDSVAALKMGGGVSAAQLTGFILYEKESYNDSIRLFDAVLKQRPSDSDALLYKAMAYEKLEDYPNAVETYTELLNVHKNRPVAWFNRANCYMALSLDHDAIKDYTRSLELNPQNLPAYYNRGLLYEKDGKNYEAIMDYSEAAVYAPKNATLLSKLAWLLATTDDSRITEAGSQAVVYAQKAVALTNNEDYKSLHILAASMAKASRYGEAAKAEKEAMMLLEQQGNHKQAMLFQKDLDRYEEMF
ncbi:MAG: tetratricopeptide repeat protein [Desulfovibrio sp.]